LCADNIVVKLLLVEMVGIAPTCTKLQYITSTIIVYFKDLRH